MIYVTDKHTGEKFPRPSVEQVAWVFQQIMDNAGRGSFRYLIYDRMGFDAENYSELYQAGGMAINEAMYHAYGNYSDEDDDKYWRDRISCITQALDEWGEAHGHPELGWDIVNMSARISEDEKHKDDTKGA